MAASVLSKSLLDPMIGASATNDRRPEFQRMIEAGISKPAPFDVVVVHSFSRFFRDHFELEFYVRKKFFHDAEMQVRTMSTPPSLSRTRGQYVDAMALYANAAAEILKFTEDGDSQRLGDAHRMDVRASEDMLRVGEVLWPGQYKPH
jgi:resolvase-like protein